MIIAFAIIFIHWFADFVLQTDEQAKQKSSSNKMLTAHVGSYSYVWLVMSFIWFSTYQNPKVLLFAPITFVCHWITDYFTSRLNTKLWKAGKVHNFFVSVGFDQVLHYAQLFLTFWLLNQ